MLVFHSLPRAAHTTLTGKLLVALPKAHTFEYYETMRVVTPRAPRNGELPILFDASSERFYRVDPWRLRTIDFCFGLFSGRKIEKRAGDIVFTFLRHPVERFYSSYFYGHERVKTLAPDFGNQVMPVKYVLRYPEMAALWKFDQKAFVDHFLERGGEILFERDGLVYGPIDESFSYPRDLHVYDFIGVTERMDASLAALSELLGVTLRNDEILNRGPGNSEPRYREEDIRQHYARDIETWERVAGRFA